MVSDVSTWTGDRKKGRSRSRARERTLSYAPPREACGFCVNWRFAAFILVAEFDRAPSLPVLPLLWPFGGIFVAATEKIAHRQG